MRRVFPNLNVMCISIIGMRVVYTKNTILLGINNYCNIIYINNFVETFCMLKYTSKWSQGHFCNSYGNFDYARNEKYYIKTCFESINYTGNITYS